LLSNPKYNFVDLFFEDESRFGLFTRNGKSLTAKGVKPICPFQQVFKSLYLFGSYSPITGEHFSLEMPSCSADIFQIYLNEFSNQFKDKFNIMVLDNGAFHKAKSLVIPENIGLIFLPPYSPELNPAEKIWAIFKRAFTNKLCPNLTDVSKFISSQVNLLNQNMIKKTCSFEYVFFDTIWTN
jgi:transposase